LVKKVIKIALIFKEFCPKKKKKKKSPYFSQNLACKPAKAIKMFMM
jgi:hypothetical protein